MNTFIWIALIIGSFIIVGIVLQIAALLLVALIEIPRSIIISIAENKRRKFEWEERIRLRAKELARLRAEMDAERERQVKINSDLAYNSGVSQNSRTLSKSEIRRIKIQKETNKVK